MNPFRDAIVASPWESTQVDVPTIHRQAFDECLGGIDLVRRNQRSAALLIHGEAGSGKTHLLSRLRARLAPQAPSATGRQECLYVWVRLQTSPRMIWRTLRRTLVDDWFRPVVNGRSQFERILFHRLAEIRTAEGDLELWYDYMLDEQQDGLAELMEQIAVKLDLDRNTAVAFNHIAFRRHLRDLRAWLAGTSLPQAALERMDLAQDEGDDVEREDQSRQIVLMMCRLAGNGLPIVLSFDQVEALQTVPHDRDALFVFGQLVSTLHDGTTNVLVVSCVQSAFHTQLKAHVRDADYDRMTSLGSLSLDPLNRAEAEQLIAARRDRAGDAVSSDASRPACWPLEPRELDELLALGSVSPRKLLTRCAERFDNAAKGETASVPAVSDFQPAMGRSDAASMSRFLHDNWEACVEHKLHGNSPDRTEEVVRHGLPMLVELVAPETKPVRDEQLPDVPLVFEKSGRRAGLSFCTQSNMNSRAAQLKRLKQQFALRRLDRLVLVCDTRVPLTQNAKAARQYLDELQQQQAVVVFPSVEALAALDALRELLSDAKSGGLAYQGEVLSPQTVGEWLQGNLPDVLRDFADEVLGTQTNGANGQAADASLIAALHEFLTTTPLAPLEEAAHTLQRPVDELADVVQRHPEYFRLLGQPPALLFRAVDSTESSA